MCREANVGLHVQSFFGVSLDAFVEFWGNVEARLGAERCFELLEGFTRSSCVNQLDPQYQDSSQIDARIRIQRRFAGSFCFINKAIWDRGQKTGLAKDTDSRISLEDLFDAWGELGAPLLPVMDADNDMYISLEEWLCFWDSALIRRGAEICTHQANLLQARLEWLYPTSPLWQQEDNPALSENNRNLAR